MQRHQRERSQQHPLLCRPEVRAGESEGERESARVSTGGISSSSCRSDTDSKVKVRRKEMDKEMKAEETTKT